MLWYGLFVLRYIVRRRRTASPYTVMLMQNLADLLEIYNKGDGSGKMYTLVLIRNYVSKKSYRVLIDEISRINNVNDLNVLLGAGMRGMLHTLVIARKAQLIEW